jgi:hypothetical protein
MDKVIGLCVILKERVGWGAVRFRGENLGRAKGLRLYLFIYFLTGLFLDYGVSMGIRSG